MTEVAISSIWNFFFGGGVPRNLINCYFCNTKEILNVLVNLKRKNLFFFLTLFMKSMRLGEFSED